MLKKCPFCGADAAQLNKNICTDDYEGKYFYVTCELSKSDCGASSMPKSTKEETVSSRNTGVPYMFTENQKESPEWRDTDTCDPDSYKGDFIIGLIKVYDKKAENPLL